jgi:sodium/potassium-transporting ATPase subunit alpha
MKGTPDRIFARCSKILINGKEVNLTDELREEIEKANIEYSNLGERVLAFARYKLSPDKYKKGY